MNQQNRSGLFRPLPSLLALAYLVVLVHKVPARQAPAAEAAASIADWLPARTLFLAETTDTGLLLELLRQGQAPAPVSDLLNQLGRGQRPAWQAELEYWLSPEGLPELQRFSSAAVAVTGQGADGQAQMAWLCRHPKDNAPGVVAILKRKLLDVGWKEHREVAGVKVYCFGAPEHPKDSIPADPDAQTEKFRPKALFAVLPEGMVYGTPEAVVEVVSRAQGQGVGANLARDAAYAAARGRNAIRPGCFCFARPEKWSENAAGSFPWPKQLPLAEVDRFNGEFSIEGLQLYGRGQAWTGSAQWQQGVPEGRVSESLLRRLPREHSGLVAVRVEPTLRLELTLRLAGFVGLDPAPDAPWFAALVRVRGADNGALEKELLTRIRQAAWFRAPAQGGQPAGQVVLLEAADAEAMKWLVATGLPRLAQAVSGGPAPAALSEPDGQGIRTWDFRAGQKWFAGQEGDAVILASQKELVARFLNPLGAGARLASDPALASFLEDAKGATGLLCLSGISQTERPGAETTNNGGKAGGGMAVVADGLGSGVAEPVASSAPVDGLGLREWALGLRRGGEVIRWQTAPQLWRVALPRLWVAAFCGSTESASLPPSGILTVQPQQGPSGERMSRLRFNKDEPKKNENDKPPR